MHKVKGQGIWGSSPCSTKIKLCGNGGGEGIKKILLKPKEEMQS
jgi:hypothetical protein